MAVPTDKRASELTAPVSIADTDVFAGYRPGTGGEPNLDIRGTAGQIRATILAGLLDGSVPVAGAGVSLSVDDLFTGSLAVALKTWMARFPSVRDRGAVPDAKQATGGAMTSGSAVLTIGTSTFSSGDVGKSIYVPGAGAAGANLWTTIASYTSATSVTLTDQASTPVNSKVVIWGTDNAAAIQALIEYSKGLTSTSGLRFPILFTRGAYLIGSPLTLYDGIELYSQGLGDEYSYCPVIFSPNSAAIDYSGTPFGIKLRGLCFVGGEGGLTTGNNFFSSGAQAANAYSAVITHCGFVGYSGWTFLGTAFKISDCFYNKAPGVSSGRGVFIVIKGSDGTFERNFADGQYIPYSDDAGATYNYIVRLEARKTRFVNNYITGSTVLANYGATALYLKGGSNNEGNTVAFNVLEFCQGTAIYAENFCSSQLIGNTITAVLKSAFDFHIAQVIYSNCHDIVQSGTLYRSVLPLTTRAQARFITGCTNIVVKDSVFDSGVTTINYQQRDTSSGCYAIEPSRPDYMRFALTANKTIDGADSGRTFYNTHASSQWAGELPAANVGIVLGFESAGAAGIKATPASGETIGAGSANQSAAVTGNGNRFSLVCNAAGAWAIHSSIGTITYS